MGLGHLPEPTRDNDSYYAAVFNNTWGHLSPQKNISYKGKVRFVYTDHSQYGCQAIILEYDFPNLDGPCIHDALFEDVCDNSDYWKGETGAIYERELTFRNYRFYYGKITQVLNSLTNPGESH